MSPPTDMPSTTSPQRDRAAAWHVRLQSETADENDWLAFEAWLAESPEHLRAYEAVEAVWRDLDEAPAAATSNIVAIRARPTRRLPVWIMAAAAACLMVIVAIGFGLWTPGTTQSYETAMGQRQVITLADGSRITLNGGSRLAASMGRRERRVFMADAEAVFDVAHDPRRPFIIQAGDREIRVVGTQFNVLHHGGQVQVTVRRGVVEVRPSGKPDAPALARLTKGQSLRHREGRPGDIVAPADPEAAFAWTQGRLVFQGEPLADVAATLSRYSAKPITVDPRAQAIPVTATLIVGDPAQMLRSLESFLPVEAASGPDSVRLSLRRQAR